MTDVVINSFMVGMVLWFTVYGANRVWLFFKSVIS